MRQGRHRTHAPVRQPTRECRNRLRGPVDALLVHAASLELPADVDPLAALDIYHSYRPVRRVEAVHHPLIGDRRHVPSGKLSLELDTDVAGTLNQITGQ